jgi:predicted MPP superfamily phosphohydrolase
MARLIAAVLRVILLLCAAAGALLLFGYREATSDPRLRTARIALEGWPAGARPVRAVLVSDLHVAGPDMPPERLRRIVDRINALRPDLVLIAGDLVSDRRLSTRRYPLREAVAPLAALRAPLGVVAVLGNHDHWRDATAARAALRSAAVMVLDNRAAAIGPLAIGGVDDDFTGHARLQEVVQAVRALRGARLLLSHSPDPFRQVPSDFGLTLAGHTHCGQIVLPWIGAFATMSRYGDRYRCGFVREHGKLLLVTAGVGTSVAPLRIGAPPEIWLLTLGGEAETRDRHPHVERHPRPDVEPHQAG